MKRCDIVIPSHNDSEKILETLVSISTQALPDGWSAGAIIVDDGSDEPVSIASNYSFPVTCIRQQHKGVAAARNFGISQSGADVVVLLGADIRLAPGALTEHIQLHEMSPSPLTAGLGFVVWDPRIHPTPLMEWMIHGGAQNDFDALLGAHMASPKHYLYGSHVSFKRALFADIMFSEEFVGYGHEDAEFGSRFLQIGGALHVLHKARAHHAHYYSGGDVIRRQRAVGRSANVYARIVGKKKIHSSFTGRQWMQIVLYTFGVGILLACIVRLVASRIALPRLYAHVAGYQYRLGSILHSARGVIR